LRYLEINFAFAQTFQIILRKNWKEELIGEVPWHVVLEFFLKKMMEHLLKQVQQRMVSIWLSSDLEY
jgi:hypothetical protein